MPEAALLLTCPVVSWGGSRRTTRHRRARMDRPAILPGRSSVVGRLNTTEARQEPELSCTPRISPVVENRCVAGPAPPPCRCRLRSGQGRQCRRVCDLCAGDAAERQSRLAQLAPSVGPTIRGLQVRVLILRNGASPAGQATGPIANAMRARSTSTLRPAQRVPGRGSRAACGADLSVSGPAGRRARPDLASTLPCVDVAAEVDVLVDTPSMLRLAVGRHTTSFIFDSSLSMNAPGVSWRRRTSASSAGRRRVTIVAGATGTNTVSNVVSLTNRAT